NDSKIKEFSPTSSGEFSVKGIVGYFDLIQIGKTTQYNNYDVGIPFHTTAGTYTTSAGSLDYLQVNGSKAEHARQMIEFLPNEGEVPSFHASTKYVIIAIGIFIIIIFAYFLDLIRK
ncbi:MAG: hypothetical protein LBD38_00275, partial [Streptococcaceae bacterium]|nr:hypothetical protein [Streptococcaceae bacterium]